MAKATNSPHGDLSTVRIGVVGHGVVGSAFTALVARQRDVIAARTGVLLDVVRIILVVAYSSLYIEAIFFIELL